MISQQRFIPTPVGNTPIRCRTSGHNSVHPHACGEHTPAPVSGAPSCGSSPRLWGTRRPDPSEAIEMRFIPTPVGNTQDTATRP